MSSAPRTREQRAWYAYDWANSAFSTTVVTLFFGPYLTSIARSAAGDGFLQIAGLPVEPRALWGYLVSLSVLLQVLVLPLAGTLADRSHYKKQWLAFWAGVGSVATVGMFWVQGTAWVAGGLLFLVSNVAFGASIVVYNSFLPEISDAEERDNVSARGWGFGYLGGGVLLALNLVLFARAGALGISEALAVRINLLSAGLWWALFTIPALLFLRNRPPQPSTGASAATQFIHTLAGMRKYPQTLLFLVAYLLYNDAVQAVIAMAAQFGNDELGIPMSTLTVVILMVQFVAFAGALAFARLSRATGTKNAILFSLVIWAGIMVGSYALVTGTTSFFVMAVFIGLVLGGTQALSRSLFSQMIPPGREAEYFGVYELSDKGTSWLAPLIFGLALQWTGNYRIAILSLLIFVVGGFVLLLAVNPERGALEARKQLH